MPTLLDKQKVLKRFKHAHLKKVHVTYQDADNTRRFVDEFEVVVDDVVWGVGRDEREAWRDAAERLERTSPQSF